MSLINQMLRDLEHRQAPPNKSTTPKVKISPPASRPQSLRNIAIGLILLFIALIYGYLPSSQRQIKPADIIVTPLPLPAKSPVETVASPVKAITTNKQSPQPKAEKTKVVSDKFTDKTPQKTLAPAPVASTKPEPLPKQQINRLLRQAEQASSTNQAHTLLQQVLLLDHLNLQARTQLARNLLQSGDIGATIQLLDESLQLFPDNPLFITTRAQLYLRQNQPAAALTLLQTQPQNNDSTYISLLAASHQQMGQYQDALPLYRKLISQQPESARHWLGLAVATDNLGQNQQAVQAYHQALRKNNLTPSILNYIKQRLSALE